jgi:hypothetical protein
MIQRFENLEIWLVAIDLCNIVYAITSTGPFSNDFKFSDQMRASSGSAFDKKYIKETQFKDLSERTDNLSRKTSNLMQHIKDCPSKGSIYS